MGDIRAQSARAALMVRPAGFGFNAETAGTNAFQTRPEEVTDSELQERAVREFDAMAEAMRKADVEVIVVEDLTDPKTPDAIFPNNWISFHDDGTVVVYPMFAPVRRLERRMDIVETLGISHGFEVSRVVDMSHHEKEERFLEGTGSIVFDFTNGVVYANISPRTHPDLLEELAATFGYELVTFSATDAAGMDVYHTNVLMSIGERFAVICADAIDDVAERKAVLDRLGTTGRELVLIDRDQMTHFAGNVIEVENRHGEKVLVMSTEAHDAFRPEQLETLGRYARIVHSPIPTVETVEGGSARCMIAGIHLPRKPVLD